MECTQSKPKKLGRGQGSRGGEWGDAQLPNPFGAQTLHYKIQMLYTRTTSFDAIPAGFRFASEYCLFALPLAFHFRIRKFLCSSVCLKYKTCLILFELKIGREFGLFFFLVF